MQQGQHPKEGIWRGGAVGLSEWSSPVLAPARPGTGLGLYLWSVQVLPQLCRSRFSSMAQGTKEKRWAGGFSLGNDGAALGPTPSPSATRSLLLLGVNKVSEASQVSGSWHCCSCGFLISQFVSPQMHAWGKSGHQDSQRSTWCPGTHGCIRAKEPRRVGAPKAKAARSPAPQPTLV